MKKKAIKSLENQIQLLEILIECSKREYKLTRSKKLKEIYSRYIIEKQKELTILEYILEEIKEK